MLRDLMFADVYLHNFQQVAASYLCQEQAEGTIENLIAQADDEILMEEIEINLETVEAVFAANNVADVLLQLSEDGVPPNRVIALLIQAATGQKFTPKDRSLTQLSWDV